MLKSFKQDCTTHITVKPVLRGHPWDNEKVGVYDR